MCEWQTNEDRKPVLVIEAGMLPYIHVAYQAWLREMGDSKERIQKFKIYVFKAKDGMLVTFIAVREPDEVNLVGGRGKNGRDVQYEIGNDLKVKGVSYFK
jgi:hypothetical protein